MEEEVVDMENPFPVDPAVVHFQVDIVEAHSLAVDMEAHILQVEVQSGPQSQAVESHATGEVPVPSSLAKRRGEVVTERGAGARALAREEVEVAMGSSTNSKVRAAGWWSRRNASLSLSRAANLFPSRCQGRSALVEASQYALL